MSPIHFIDVGQRRRNKSNNNGSLSYKNILFTTENFILRVSTRINHQSSVNKDKEKQKCQR